METKLKKMQQIISKKLFFKLINTQLFNNELVKKFNAINASKLVKTLIFMLRLMIFKVK